MRAENPTMSFEQIYRAARKSGMGQADATQALITAGLDFDRAVDLCWLIEAGRATPEWAKGNGVTRAKEGGHSESGEGQ